MGSTKVIRLADSVAVLFEIEVLVLGGMGMVFRLVSETWVDLRRKLCRSLDYLLRGKLSPFKMLC